MTRLDVVRRIAPSLLILGGLAALVFLAYPSALALPFFFDDPFDLPRAEARSLWTIVSSAPDYGYYRPLLYVLWKGLRLLLGRYDPFWFHFLTVAAHVLNGWLVFLLGRRLAGGLAGLLAATLFVLYPFSYQVVPWAGALFHPFMTLLLLAALLLYLEAGRRRRPLLLLPALVLAGLGMFTHEYGVMVAPLALLWPLLRLPGRDKPPRARYALAFFALAAAFLVVWYLVPKWGRAPLGFHPESLRLSGLYFAQGFAYPIAPLAKPLAVRLGGSPELALAALSALAILTLAVLYWRGGQFRLFLLAFLWFLLAVLPAWAVLDFAYVVDAPRLLYLASIGAALAWGGLVALFPARRVAGYLWRPAVVLGLALVAAQSWQFIAARNTLYDAGGWLIREVMAAAQEGAALYVNLPAWLAFPEDQYVLGHSGVVLIPDYVGLDAATHVHLGHSVPARSATYEPAMSAAPYVYGPHGVRASVEQIDALARRASAVYLTRFLPDGPRLEEAGRLTPDAPAPDGVLATFGDSFALRSAEVAQRDNACAVTLDWFVRRPAAADNTVFLHLYDDAGKLVAQQDGYPLRQLSPPRLWRAGDGIVDRRTLALPDALPAGRYTLVAGMYDRQTGQRLAARDAAGARLKDDAAVIGEVVLR